MRGDRIVGANGQPVRNHELLRALRNLTGPERDVLELRLGLYGHRVTVEETSRQLGMSLEQVRAIERLALSKLRHPSSGLVAGRRPHLDAA